MVSSLSVGQLANRQCPNHSLWSPDVSCLPSTESRTFYSLNYELKVYLLITMKKSDLFYPLLICAHLQDWKKTLCRRFISNFCYSQLPRAFNTLYLLLCLEIQDGNICLKFWFDDGRTWSNSNFWKGFHVACEYSWKKICLHKAYSR